jgi:hypothetical protein
MQDNIRIYFTDKVKFEKIVRSNGNYNCTINSEDIRMDKLNNSIYPIKGDIGSMKYVVHQNSAFIENSIHKYHNLSQNGQDINYNDFSYCNIVKTLDDIRNQLPEYDFSETKVTSLEFGFNIKLNFSARDFIVRNVLLYQFKTHYVFKNEKDFVLKKFKAGNCIFKIYDKGRQNNLDYQLLRIELKYNSKGLRSKNLGINNIDDLYDPKKIELLYEDFLIKFAQLIIVDDRFTQGLSKQEIANLGNKLEYTYWKRKDISASTISRHKISLKNYIEDNSLNKMFKYLRKEIIKKFDELFKDCEGSIPITS